MTKKITISNLVIIIIAVLFSGYASIYFDFGKHVLGKPQVVFEDPIWQFCFYSHIASGIIAFLTGSLQFISYLRLKYAALHKKIGKIYIASVFIAGVLSFYTSFFANGGFWGKAGFLTIAVMWIFTTYTALNSIRKGQIEKHRHWMIRSYSITWVSISLRIWLSLFSFVFHFSFSMAYPLSIWMALLLNLLIGEYIIRKPAKPAKIINQ
jgi:uncharacterized membrane protein